MNHLNSFIQLEWIVLAIGLVLLNSYFESMSSLNLTICVVVRPYSSSMFCCSSNRLLNFEWMVAWQTIHSNIKFERIAHVIDRQCWIGCTRNFVVISHSTICIIALWVVHFYVLYRYKILAFVVISRAKCVGILDSRIDYGPSINVFVRFK